MNRGWIYVALTCFFELCWVYGFNVATDITHWLMIACLIVVDFTVLSKACEYLPTGTVYAVFAGVGTVGTTLMDVFFFGAVLNSFKIFFIILLIIGVVGLKKFDEDEVKEIAYAKEVR